MEQVNRTGYDEDVAQSIQPYMYLSISDSLSEAVLLLDARSGSLCGVTLTFAADRLFPYMG